LRRVLALENELRQKNIVKHSKEHKPLIENNNHKHEKKKGKRKERKRKKISSFNPHLKSFGAQAGSVGGCTGIGRQ
jgi:hypothetical protein